MDKHVIVGVHITNRIKNAGEVQRVLTDFGASIKTRLGLNDMGGGEARPSGLILLEMVGAEANRERMVEQLKGIEGVEIQQMIFEHR